MTVQEEFTHLSEDLKLVQDDLSRLLSEVSAAAGTMSQEARERTMDRIRALQNRSAELSSKVKTRVHDTATAVDGSIKDNPYKAVAVAGIAGAVLGYFLASKK